MHHMEGTVAQPRLQLVYVVGTPRTIALWDYVCKVIICGGLKIG